jgi:glycylpeptide N-tetradecanoyltransferase
MKLEYVPQVKALLDNYLAKFPLAPILSEEDIKHWLLPIPNVIYSYVVKDKESGEITDFISFYSLPSTVVGNAKHTHLYAAYLFYYAPKGMGADKERTKALVNDAIILAKNVRSS